MRTLYHTVVAVAIVGIVSCYAFIFAVDVVFYDRIHNIDVDGRRGAAIMAASAEATRRDEIRETLYGDNFTVWLGEVVRVIDGDTLEILHVPNREIRKVRLWGIDCPEHGQPYGNDATRFVSDRLTGKRVDVVEINAGKRDRYGRVVAVVEIDGVADNLNAALLATGYAWVFPRYCDRPVS